MYKELRLLTSPPTAIGSTCSQFSASSPIDCRSDTEVGDDEEVSYFNCCFVYRDDSIRLSYSPSKEFDVHCKERRPSHEIDITREAIREGADAVVAVGGDGTLHEVVNGFFWGGKPITKHDSKVPRTTSLGGIIL
ncbi:hypothetical protein L1887_26809 [Cichorium endivia]|nr:hypothetical protein L1887_26809 [Cichorium endivia]